MKKWITQDNKEIPFNELEDSHLLNILKWIERRAKNGMEISVNMGYGEHDYCEYSSYTIHGEEVKKQYDYYELKKEALNRKII